MKSLALMTFLALTLVVSPGLTSAQEAKLAKTIGALEAWDMLTREPKNTFLLDVRTRADYTLLGHAPQAYNVPWRFLSTDFQVKGGPFAGGKADYTGYQLDAKANPDFVRVVKSLFKPEDRIIVISSNGSQGAQAADALAKDGFKQVYNVRHGFWGDPLNSKEHGELAQKYSPYSGMLGRLNGWVFWGLPTTRAIDPRYIYPPDVKRMKSVK